MRDVEVLAAAVSQAVGSYKRRKPWLDEGDLRQEAWTGALEAYKTWDPARGPLDRYATRAVYLRVKRWALRLGPMSFTDNTAGRKAFAEGSPRGAPLETAIALSDPTPPADERIDETAWRIRVHARLVQSAGGRTCLQLAMTSTSRAAAEVRDRLASDEELRALWLERSETA
jgi:hypothetical protein